VGKQLFEKLSSKKIILIAFCSLGAEVRKLRSQRPFLEIFKPFSHKPLSAGGSPPPAPLNIQFWLAEIT